MERKRAALLLQLSVQQCLNATVIEAGSCTKCELALMSMNIEGHLPAKPKSH